MYVYETFVVIWITFGLGYVLMIIMAISDGLKKPASKVAKGFRKAEKVLLEKVLTEVVALKTATRRNQNVNTSADVSDGLSFHNAAFEATPNTVNSYVSTIQSDQRGESRYHYIFKKLCGECFAVSSETPFTPLHSQYYGKLNYKQ